METSDSEYFESADEDFCTDDDTKSHARNVKSKSDGTHGVTDKIKQPSVSYANHKIDEKDDTSYSQQSEKESPTLDVKNETLNDITHDITGESTGNSQRTIWDNNDWDELETTSTGKHGTKTKVQGVKVKISGSKDEVEQNMWDDDNDWNEIETMIKNESKSTIKKTSAAKAPAQPKENYEAPPGRVDCWEEGVNTVNTYMKEVSKKAEDLAISQTPDRTSCPWERDISIDSPVLEGKPAFGTIGDTKKVMKHEPLTQTENLDEPDDEANKENEENVWDNDEWEPLEEAPASPKEHTSWTNWGNWGISSVISTASTLTSHMSQGLSNVLESGIGAPDPEELARINKLEKEQRRETKPDPQQENKSKLTFDLGNFVQGVTKLVETTGNKVITGGLDTLETIGKKTMEVLQENDPGLMKKRAFLSINDEKPILSQVLREAKEKAERDNKKSEERQFAKRANYEMLFDDHQGLVHLEALEMLSKQCDIKLQNILKMSSDKELTDIQETMEQVKELCEIPEEDENEFLTSSEAKEILELAVSELNVSISYNRLLKLWDEVENWLSNINHSVCSEQELHQQAIETLAQLTAISVEQFHKCGELLLVKEYRSTADEAVSLVQLTTTLTALIDIAAAKFSEKLNNVAANNGKKENINDLITNVFFEAANSSSYIQDAFQLLIPVLQVGAV